VRESLLERLINQYSLLNVEIFRQDISAAVIVEKLLKQLPRVE
jgi:hypothetical protein